MRLLICRLARVLQGEEGGCHTVSWLRFITAAIGPLPGLWDLAQGLDENLCGVVGYLPGGYHINFPPPMFPLLSQLQEQSPTAFASYSMTDT
jgi:hypothetical protein